MRKALQVEGSAKRDGVLKNIVCVHSERSRCEQREVG